MAIDAATRDRVIAGAIEQISRNYAYPDEARRIAESIQARMRLGAYHDVRSASALVTILNRDIQEVRPDPHLRIEYTSASGKTVSPTATTTRAVTPEEARQEREKWLRYGEARNFFIDRAERLPGNIGYLKLSAFFFADMAGATLANAMGFVSRSDALIVDLRGSGGGDTAMANLFVSYFFDGPVKTGESFDARTNSRKESWTLSYVGGTPYATRDLFILTSNDIYSAPEAVAKVLQRMRHAVIVGEPTRGATNVTAGFAIDEHFSVSVPYTRSIDQTGKDLTRTGVEPDIRVAAASALRRAQIEALRRLKGKSLDKEIEAERANTMAALEKVLANQ